ncbi:hypothetical protein RDABS01_019329, partial [Bienertia sinuspersici]
MVTPKQLLLTIESTLLSSSTPSPSDLVEIMHAIRSSRSSLQNLLSYPPPRPSDRTEVQSKEVRLPNSASISLDDQDALKLSDDLHLNEIECVRLLVSANQEWGLLGREPWEILRLAIGLWYTERRDLITALYTLLRVSPSKFHNRHFPFFLSVYLISFIIQFLGFLQAVVLDQDIEGDLVADIQKYLEDLINTGLRQRLINLIKELNLEEPAGLGGPNAERFIIDARGAVVERRAVVSRERLILSHCLVLSVLVMAPVNDPNVGGFVNCVRLAWSVHLMVVQDAIAPKETVSSASSKYLQNIGSCLEVIFSNNVFQFFLDKVLGTAAYQNDDEDMTYMYNAYLHKLITIFLSEPLARDK